MHFPSVLKSNKDLVIIRRFKHWKKLPQYWLWHHSIKVWKDWGFKTNFFIGFKSNFFLTMVLKRRAQIQLDGFQLDPSVEIKFFISISTCIFSVKYCVLKHKWGHAMASKRQEVRLFFLAKQVFETLHNRLHIET